MCLIEISASECGAQQSFCETNETFCSRPDQISWNLLYFDLGVGAGELGERMFRLFLLCLQHLEAIDPTSCLLRTHKV